MVKAQPALQLTEDPIDESPAEPLVKNEIARIMTEYYARLDEITPRALAESPQQAIEDVADAADGNGKKPGTTVRMSKIAADTGKSKAASQISKEDSYIINESRRKVQQASTSLGALQKEMNKMEAYKKVLMMVRRSLNATNRNFWDSVYTTTDNTV